MSLSGTMLDALVDSLHHEMTAAGPGHCLRVDNLSADDVGRLRERLAARVAGTDILSLVLGTGGGSDQATIPVEKAIEYRNRKTHRVCLFIPAGQAADAAAAKSLANSFAVFDLNRCWKQAADDCLRDLPQDLRDLVREVRRQLRGPLKATHESWAGYITTVADHPSAETIGRELWRIGLIPDRGTEGLAGRLDDNRRAVMALVRPTRPQSSLDDRLEALHMTPGPGLEALRGFLKGYILRDAESWQRALGDDTHRALSFEHWAFERIDSDLKAIRVTPFLDASGAPIGGAGLSQPDGPNTLPQAAIGPRAKLKVSWKPEPAGPGNLHRWQVSLIPSRDADDEDADLPLLPEATAAPNSRSKQLSLDLDLGDRSGLLVQARVVGLDRHGRPIAGAAGVIEGLSDECYLVKKAAETGETAGATRPRQATAETLPQARLQAAQLPADTPLELTGCTAGPEGSGEFSLTFNNQSIARLTVAPLLQQIERHALTAPDADLGRFSVRVDAAESLSLDRLRPAGLPALDAAGLAGPFRAARQEVARRLTAQGTRGLVEVADWTPALDRAARGYAAAWRDLLARDLDPEARLEALSVETLEITLDQSQGAERALLLLPTHPLRLLWYAAYTALLRHWEADLLDRPEAERKRQLDHALVAHLTPLNCPVIAAAFDGEPFLFSHNLGFFWGVALPVGVPDPGRRVADLARLLELPTAAVILNDLEPARLTRELDEYRSVHPYLRTLRLNLLNPGTGEFIAEALRGLYAAPVAAGTGDVDGEADGEEAVVTVAPPRLELTVQAPPPLPLALPALAELQRELYENRPADTTSNHLEPWCTLALRALGGAVGLPEGEANLAIQTDTLVPALTPAQAAAASAGGLAVHGLLARLVPEFISDADSLRWHHRLALPDADQLCPHPAGGDYATGLLETHRALLGGLGRLLGFDGEPVVTATLSPDALHRLQAIHEHSDWVITFDRFLGVEYFDHPRHPALGDLARQYLLDYVPEFLEGLGHRLLVTTAHREEVAEILDQAMSDLGFREVEASVGAVLGHLKTISGRLALRVIGDTSRAREAVSLGLVAAWLRERGELGDSLLIPVDAHLDLFGPAARTADDDASRQRCDLIQIRCHAETPSTLEATFVEVKGRFEQGTVPTTLFEQMVDQMTATERDFTERFFPTAGRRVDQALQDARLAGLLRFYLSRAERHGLVSGPPASQHLQAAIARVEAGRMTLTTRRHGYVVNLPGTPRAPWYDPQREAEVRVLTAHDLPQGTVSTPPSGRGPTDSDAGPDDDQPSRPPAPGGLSAATPPVAGAHSPAPRPAGAADLPRPETAANIPLTLPEVPPSADSPAATPWGSVTPAPVEASGPPITTGAAAPSAPCYVRPRPDDGQREEAPGTATDSTPTAPAAVAPEAPAPPPAFTTAAGPSPAPRDSGGWDGSDPDASGVPRPRQLRLLVGHTETGVEVYYEPSLQGNPHGLVVGIPGMGKTTLVVNLCIAAAQAGVAPFVVDFHGDLARDLRRLLGDDCLIMDARQGLPFNPFEIDRERRGREAGWKEHAYETTEILGNLFSDLGDLQRGILREVMISCYEQAGWTDDPAICQTLTAPPFESLSWALSQHPDKSTQKITTRLQSIFDFNLFRPGEGALDLTSILARPTVLLLSSIGVEDNQRIAASFFLQRLYREMFDHVGTLGLRNLIVFDEAHRVAKLKLIPKMMQECRKYGLAFVVSSQRVADFDLGVLESAGNQFYLRVNTTDAKRLGDFLGDRAYARQLQELPRYHALFRSEQHQPFVPVTLAPPAGG